MRCLRPDGVDGSRNDSACELEGAWADVEYDADYEAFAEFVA